MDVTDQFHDAPVLTPLYSSVLYAGKEDIGWNLELVPAQL
jgi:hypothetical protein